MIRPLLFLMFLSATSMARAQGFIGKPVHKVRKQIETHMAKEGVQGRLHENGETLTLLMNDPAFKQAQFTYRFENGRCVEEKITACDTCVLKYFNENLQKNYGWTPVNDSTYLSRYGKHLRMTRQLGAQPELLIQHISLTRREYEALVRKQ